MTIGDHLKVNQLSKHVARIKLRTACMNLTFNKCWTLDKPMASCPLVIWAYDNLVHLSSGPMPCMTILLNLVKTLSKTLTMQT